MPLTRDVELSREHYRECFLQYGDSPFGMQWSSIESQNKRFEILLEIAEIEGCSILDFGCGTGALFEYMNSKKKYKNVSYAGCDIVSESLAMAREKYDGNKMVRFGYFDEFSNDIFDYVFSSGVFNIRMKDNVSYYQDYLRILWEHTGKGLAFNMMSSYVDYYTEDLFYEKPEAVFSFVKENLSPFVVLRNDYQVKPGVIPFEFTIYVYRKDFVRR